MTKILIIEDEIRLADVLYDWFYNKNFQVTVCHDGISGYETALRNSYDAIISDVMLPGIDGFSIVKKIEGYESLDTDYYAYGQSRAAGQIAGI